MTEVQVQLLGEEFLSDSGSVLLGEGVEVKSVLIWEEKGDLLKKSLKIRLIERRVSCRAVTTTEGGCQKKPNVQVSA